jgi:hypothetical protein
MKKDILVLLVLAFIVSWPAGKQPQKVKCEGKEPEDITCVKLVDSRKAKEFKSEEAANEFAQALTESGAADVQVTKK